MTLLEYERYELRTRSLPLSTRLPTLLIERHDRIHEATNQKKNLPNTHLLSENKVFAFHVYGNRNWTKLYGIVLFIFFPSATERKISGKRPEIRKMPCLCPKQQQRQECLFSKRGDFPPSRSGNPKEVTEYKLTYYTKARWVFINEEKNWV